MTAALELRNAGYNVKVLEYNRRPGGRNWTIRGGDMLHRARRPTQDCDFDDGLYHQSRAVAHPLSPPRDAGLLQTARRRARAVRAGQSQRLSARGRGVRRQAAALSRDQGGFSRHVAELLSKAVRTVRSTERSRPKTAKCSWRRSNLGRARHRLRLQGGPSSERRGYAKAARRRLVRRPVPANRRPSDILKCGFGDTCALRLTCFQTTLFQPVGGMDMIGKAFATRSGRLLHYAPRSRTIRQDAGGVSVQFVDSRRCGGPDSPGPTGASAPFRSPF